MVVQVDLRFKLDGSGWSERYHLDPPDGPLDEVGMRLCRARFPLLDGPAMLLDFRASRPGERAGVARRTLRWVGEQKEILIGGEVKLTLRPAPLPYFGVAQMLWLTESGGKRFINLGGVRNSVGPAGRTSLAQFHAPEVVEKLDNFRNALGDEDLNLQIRTLVEDDRGSVPVRGITRHASGLYQITTADDYPVSSGGQVRVMGSRGRSLSNARGVRFVRRVLGPRDFLLDRGPLPGGPPLLYTGGAVLRGVAYSYHQAVWFPVAADDPRVITIQPFSPFRWTFELYRDHPEAYGVSSRQRGFGASARAKRAAAR